MDNAAQLDLLQKTPFSEMTAFWAHEAPQLGKNNVEVTQWVIKRELVDQLVKTLSDQGFIVRRMLISKVETHQPLVDFPKVVSPWAKRVPLLNCLLAACAIASLVWSQASPVLSVQSATIQLRTQISERTTRAVTLRVELDDRLATVQSEEALRTALAQQLMLSAALEALTEALPDEVWVTGLEMRDERIVASLTSRTAAPALALMLGDLTQFSDVRIVGPIATLPQGRVRFDLSLSITLVL
ncbi:MAG: hypothetical protein Gyms2KO_03420 [Gymnodinialimonas sp.]